MIVLLAVALAAAPRAEGQIGTNILSNPGFESGDTIETADDLFGVLQTDEVRTGVNCGGEVVAVNMTNPRSGDFALEWGPIGWDSGSDNNCDLTTVNAHSLLLIFNDASAEIAAGANSVTFSGFVNTEFSDVGISINLSTSDVAANFGPGSGIVEIDIGSAGYVPFSVTTWLDPAFPIVAPLMRAGVENVSENGPIFIDDLSVVYNIVPPPLNLVCPDDIGEEEGNLVTAEVLGVCRQTMRGSLHSFSVRR